MMKVAILGAGPSGLLTAWAVERSGHEPVIYGRRHKSVVSPSMFLMKEIPGLSLVEFNLDIEVRGTAEGYAKRVYRNGEMQVSLSTLLPGQHKVWGLREAYDRLWSIYQSSIVVKTIGYQDLSGIANSHELTLCTLPAPDLCVQAHEFKSVDTFLVRAPAEDESFGRPRMIYNGMNGDAQTAVWNWYRYSSIRGVETWEYTHLVPGHQTTGVKPIGNNCDCWEQLNGGRFRRVGRFGKWQHGVMMHHAFEDAVAAMASEGLGRTV